MWNDHYSLLRHLTMDWPIINLLSTGSMATVGLHCVQFPTLKLQVGVLAVKTRNFCRDLPAVYDDLHSSHCRSKTDGKFTFLILAQ